MHSISFKIRNLEVSTPILLAPMAGISDLPYRLIMKPAGCGLVISEMVSAAGLVRGNSRNQTRDLLVSRPEERPFGIQLFGSDPDLLAEAARQVADQADLIDINMGCPVPKVVRGNGGSALLRDPQLVGRIVSAVRGAWHGPLTVKIRSGWDAAAINYVDVGRIAAEAGADAVILHPRTRSQGFSGHSDWSHIARLKESLPIPVIGSGDIVSAADGLRMLAETGCDAVMIGRGGYGNPWLIAELYACLTGRTWHPPTIQERGETARRHLALSREIFGERKSLNEMRKHLCWYARGICGSALFRQSINRAPDLAALTALIDSFFTESAHEPSP